MNSNIFDKFIIGESYSNEQIFKSFKVANSGGIRIRKNKDKTDFIIIISSQENKKNKIKNPYEDTIEGEKLIYTGEGLKGNQILNRGNKRIVEQYDEKFPILFFKKLGTNDYIFEGFLILLRHYYDFQLGNDGILRNVIKFEFLIKNNFDYIKINNFKNEFQKIYCLLDKSYIIDNEDKIVDNTYVETIEENIELPTLEIEKFKNKLLAIDPYEFEKIIGNLIKHLGFKNVNVTKKSLDGGVDINAILEYDFSIDLKYYFQVKRRKGSVGRNEVANLKGSLEDINSNATIITTSYFTKSAIENSNIGKKVKLIDIKDLYEIITRHGFKII